MTQNDMATLIAAHTGCTGVAAARAVVELFAALAGDLVVGTPVRLPSIGRVARIATPAREGRNPRTGAPLAVPAGHRIKFTQAKAMKARLGDLPR